jgi:hypothetical protein
MVSTVTPLLADFLFFSLHSIFICFASVTTATAKVTPENGLTTIEPVGIATFAMELDAQPYFGVTIAVASSDTGEGIPSTSSLSFTTDNWDAQQTVTVTAVEDDEVDGDTSYQILTGIFSSSDTNFNDRGLADVAITNIDGECLCLFASTFLLLEAMCCFCLLS